MRLKVLSLIFLSFLTIGCNTNYQSLNNLVLVSSILIHRDDDNYITYLELYKNNKNDDVSSYYIKGTGKTIYDSINNASNSVSKNLYFVHLNAVIISLNIAKSDINNIFNYLEEQVSMNSNYYLLVTDDIDGLINNHDSDNNILGEKVTNLLKYSSNIGSMINYNFMEKLNNYSLKNKDIYLSKISIVNDNITIKDGIYFSNNNLVGSLNDDEIKLINIFNNNQNIYFEFDDYTLKVDKSNIKYNIDNSININLKIYVNIVDSKINIDNEDVIKNIEKNLEEYLNNNITNLINKLRKSNSDILGLNDYIYRKHKSSHVNYFTSKYNLNIDVAINKNGPINGDEI